MKAHLLLLIVMALFLAGCSNDDVLRASVEKELSESLAVGDSREKIDRVLKEKAMRFSFNAFDHRYETGVDPKEVRSIQRVVTVWIYVDRAGRLTKIEVRNTYTYF